MEHLTEVLGPGNSVEEDVFSSTVRDGLPKNA